MILLLALIVGATAAGLGYLAHRSVPEAALIGGSAAGGALVPFNTLIGR